MKDMKRAQRRHHVARLKRVCAGWLARDVRESPRHLGKRVTTPAPCSCWMCGNKRRHEGLTIQELRDIERMREWVS
jgi:hypothetical protein